MKLVAATVPKRTLVAPVNPVPVMVTVVPPAVEPEVGEMAVVLGAGGRAPKRGVTISPGKYAEPPLVKRMGVGAPDLISQRPPVLFAGRSLLAPVHAPTKMLSLASMAMESV